MTYQPFLRSHVYFKDNKMHGKYPNESGALSLMLLPPRFGQAFGGHISLDHWCVSAFIVKYRAASLKNEEDRELEIIHDLAERVLPFAEAISEACDICAELDCLLCFAEAANLYNYRRPQMSSENVINIKQGRCVLVPNTRCDLDAHPIRFLKAPVARANRRHIRAK
jgi:hypothetical protein